MMARAHRRVHPAITFLMRTFAPGGDPIRLRTWSAKLEKKGERVTLTFDLPDGDARRSAAKLVRSGPALTHVAVGGKAIREIAVGIDGDVLNVTALLGRA